MRKAFLFVMILWTSTSLFAQKFSKNIVPNPSFETHKSKSPVIKSATPWQNVGTVDYYYKPDKKDTSKFKGAHSGTCYAGLRFQAKYKEYMYVQLLEPLVEGNTYYFEMFFRLQEQSTVKIKQLGVYFAETPFSEGMEFKHSGMIDTTYKRGISADQGWAPIRGEYIAKGGEKYIVIGNFRTIMKDDFVRQNKWEIFETREAYYYVDDISVLKPTILIEPPKKVLNLPETFKTGQIIPVKNIDFEKSANAILTKPSYRVLDELAEALNKFPLMEVQINGYTDSDLAEPISVKVSFERAKAVYTYLLKKGVLNPIKYEGFGSKKPIVPNNSPENKAKNNRIEMVIIKQQQ